MRIEFGCGRRPPPTGWVAHDRWQHSPHIEIAHDLEQLPWPWANGSLEEIRAIDVFEHLHLEVQEWLDECWRVLEPNGALTMRLPAWNNPYSWRDPTHRRVFHAESFNYWCPTAPGTVWHEFGSYYFGEGYAKWWTLQHVMTECHDLKFILRKMS